jgi:hypothetical protein
MLHRLTIRCELKPVAAKRLYNKIVADEPGAYQALRTRCLNKGLDIDEINILYSDIQAAGYIGGGSKKYSKTQRCRR